MRSKTLYRYWMLIIAAALVFASLGTSPAAAQSACPNPYTVQRGDTLTAIAARCGTTTAALLQANPTITNPSRIYTGQRLTIPSQAAPTPTPTPVVPETVLPSVALAPSCGLPGSQVKVYGSGMPARSSVEIRLGKSGGTSSLVTTVQSDAKGFYTAQATIPGNAGEKDAWVVTASARTGNTTIQSISNPFDVVRPVVVSGVKSEEYKVASGDTLRKIATRFNTTVAAILAVNPKITNPDIIYVGQVLRIPQQNAGDVVVLLSPTCGVPGSQLSITASGFADKQTVELKLRGVHDNQIDDKITASKLVQADSSGKLTLTMDIPKSASLDSNWVVTAHRYDGGEPVGISNGFAVSAARNSRDSAAYIVQRGDTLSQIAVKHDRRLGEILGANPQITNRNRINVGQVILIPARGS